MTQQGDTRAAESTAGVGSIDAVALELPAQSRYIRVARLVGAGLANELGLAVDRLDDVRLAIGEACGLAVLSGARALSLRYVLDDATLTVGIEAGLGESEEVLAREDLALVEQVLAVACSSHNIDRRDGRVAVRLTFADGH
jgi:anti-sigma regulatory factor (Ser/Thr protein kinase)